MNVKKVVLGSAIAGGVFAGSFGIVAALQGAAGPKVNPPVTSMTQPVVDIATPSPTPTPAPTDAPTTQDQSVKAGSPLSAESAQAPATPVETPTPNPQVINVNVGGPVPLSSGGHQAAGIPTSSVPTVDVGGN